MFSYLCVCFVSFMFDCVGELFAFAICVGEVNVFPLKAFVCVFLLCCFFVD